MLTNSESARNAERDVASSTPPPVADARIKKLGKGLGALVRTEKPVRVPVYFYLFPALSVGLIFLAPAAENARRFRTSRAA
jgi:hypothetical protein